MRTATVAASKCMTVLPLWRNGSAPQVWLRLLLLLCLGHSHSLLTDVCNEGLCCKRLSPHLPPEQRHLHSKRTWADWRSSLVSPIGHQDASRGSKASHKSPFSTDCPIRLVPLDMEVRFLTVAYEKRHPAGSDRGRSSQGLLGSHASCGCRPQVPHHHCLHPIPAASMHQRHAGPGHQRSWAWLLAPCHPRQNHPEDIVPHGKSSKSSTKNKEQQSLDSGTEQRVSQVLPPSAAPRTGSPVGKDGLDELLPSGAEDKKVDGAPRRR